jgi:hypothetical protein
LPQINTRTHARAVIAVLGLAACGGANTTAPPTTTLSIDSDPYELVRPEIASLFSLEFQARGLTITSDQANCMVDGVLDEIGMNGIDQLRRAYVAGKPDDPAVVDRATKAIRRCLSTDAVTAPGHRND